MRAFVAQVCTWDQNMNSNKAKVHAEHKNGRNLWDPAGRYDVTFEEKRKERLAAMPKSSNEKWSEQKKNTMRPKQKPQPHINVAAAPAKGHANEAKVQSHNLFHRVTWTRTRPPVTEQNGSEDRESRYVFRRYHQTEQENW